jgi:ParB/RepB/Spo0J family partition protein
VTTAAPRLELRIIPTLKIRPPALPSRTTMDDELMDELVRSMERDGFVSVIGVVPIDDDFEVVYGHRRRIAAERASIPAIPCFVFESKTAATMRLQYGENKIREALSPTDEAVLFRQLLDDDPSVGTDGLAARLGEKRDYVEGRLALFHGCERVFAALADKAIPIGVATELNRCTEDAHRFMLLDMAIRGGATVGLVKQWVHEWRTQHLPASAAGAAAAPGPAGPTPITQNYFQCRICGETQNTANMLPVNVHDYCLQQLIDPATGIIRSRADFVQFPRTREAAVALIQRFVERFPEIAG